MKLKQAHKLLILIGCLSINFNSYAQEVTEAMRKSCLPATDYEGCIRSHLSPPSAKEEIDFLGLPKIKEWTMLENRPDNEVWYIKDQAYKVKARGVFGRYISYEWVYRWNQKATPGRPGYSTTIGTASTRCSNLGYGVINCTTKPASTINIPGTAGTPGGIEQMHVITVIDCLERKVQNDGKGAWTAMEDEDESNSKANEWCNKIETLPESSIKTYAEGSPNEKDILAKQILPGSDPEFIKRQYAVTK